MADTVTAGATMASVRPKPNLRPLLSLTTDTVDTEATVEDMEDMVDTEATVEDMEDMVVMVVTVLDTAGATMASVRLRLSPTMATEVMEATVADTEAMADTVTAGATMASVRPKPNLRPLLSLTTDTVDTEDTVEDMEDMVVTVLGTAGATTASVRLRLSPTMATVATMVATTASVRPRLSPTMAMEVMEDMVDTVEVT